MGRIGKAIVNECVDLYPDATLYWNERNGPWLPFNERATEIMFVHNQRLSDPWVRGDVIIAGRLKGLGTGMTSVPDRLVKLLFGTEHWLVRVSPRQFDDPEIGIVKVFDEQFFDDWPEAYANAARAVFGYRHLFDKIEVVRADS